jgi:hypothetical protein
VQIGGWSIRTAFVEESGDASYQPANGDIAKVLNKNEDMALQNTMYSPTRKYVKEAASSIVCKRYLLQKGF